jgi:tetratricopeptide (TPR) repeat protein
VFPREFLQQNHQQTATAMAHEFDCLPLALDQAGAYTEEKKSTLRGYLTAYTRRRAELLGQRGRAAMGYPASVATTWSLNFEQVEQDDPLAADLLRFLAFLAPDAIPEDLIIKGATKLGPHLEALATDETRFDEAVGLLLRFSLVQRSTDQQQLFIHRLVQAVQRDKMAYETQQEWADRTVRAVNLALPNVVDDTGWEQWERDLPHALVCTAHIEAYRFTFTEAADLLHQTASFLEKKFELAQAEPLYERALAIYEQQLGPMYPDTIHSLNTLGGLYCKQGKYEQAESLYQRTLAIYEQQLGPMHPYTTTVREIYNNLVGYI